MNSVVITGASKGIGKYLFDTFTNKGYSVFGTYNLTNPTNNIKDQYFQVDVSNYESVSKWVIEIEKSLNRIVLINCAGINYNAWTYNADIELWNQVIDVNLKGTYNVIRRILPIMRKQNFGRIINFSSVVVKYPTKGVSAYAASKAGLIGLTKSLAIENGPKGITANTINLGYVNLGMGKNEVPITYQEIIKSKIPCGRFCNPDEVLNTIKYIIDTEYLNGSSIDLNGCLI